MTYRPLYRARRANGHRTNASCDVPGRFRAHLRRVRSTWRATRRRNRSSHRRPSFRGRDAGVLLEDRDHPLAPSVTEDQVDRGVIMDPGHDPHVCVAMGVASAVTRERVAARVRGACSHAVPAPPRKAQGLRTGCPEDRFRVAALQARLAKAVSRPPIHLGPSTWTMARWNGSRQTSLRLLNPSAIVPTSS